MEFTAVQWNIGGARLLAEDADPNLLASYSVDGLDYVIDLLRQQNADVITLQETHTSAGYSQAQLIAESLGYRGWMNNELAESHIDPTQRLGLAIITKQPLIGHDFALFYNPPFQVDLGDGRIETSHDKGRIRVVTTLENERELTVQTLHVTPFRRSKTPIDSPEAQRVLADVAAKLAVAGTGIVQGDFNLDLERLEPHLPSLFVAGFHEIPQHAATAIPNYHFDHVLYRGMRVLQSIVLQDVLTDHFPVVTRFKLPEI